MLSSPGKPGRLRGSPGFVPSRARLGRHTRRRRCPACAGSCGSAGPRLRRQAVAVGVTLARIGVVAADFRAVVQTVVVGVAPCERRQDPTLGWLATAGPLAMRVPQAETTVGAPAMPPRLAHRRRRPRPPEHQCDVCSDRLAEFTPDRWPSTRRALRTAWAGRWPVARHHGKVSGRPVSWYTLPDWVSSAQSDAGP